MPPGNEDPYVLGPRWAYSYCHATQLRRRPRSNAPFVSRGSCIIFCSGDLADSDEVLAVDTVFWVAEAHAWEGPDRPPRSFATDVDGASGLWRYHLRFGGRGGHVGAYTYEGALHPQPGDRYSHLPLGADGRRAQVELALLSPDLRASIMERRRGKYPLLVSPAQLAELLGHLQPHTAIQVIHELVLDDPDVEALRERGTSSPCGPCVEDESASDIERPRSRLVCEHHWADRR